MSMPGRETGRGGATLCELNHNEAMSTTRQADMIEGPQAFKRFEDAMRKVLKVPHAVIQRKIAEHRAESDKNPKKRGPKRKA